MKEYYSESVAEVGWHLHPANVAEIHEIKKCTELAIALVHSSNSGSTDYVGIVADESAVVELQSWRAGTC